MTKSDTIDITPTWRGVVPMLVDVAANGTTPDSRKMAMNELLKLADIVDKHIAELAKLEAELPERCADCGVRGSHAYGCPRAPGTLADE